MQPESAVSDPRSKSRALRPAQSRKLGLDLFLVLPRLIVPINNRFDVKATTLRCTFAQMVLLNERHRRFAASFVGTHVPKRLDANVNSLPALTCIPAPDDALTYYFYNGGLMFRLLTGTHNRRSLREPFR